VHTQRLMKQLITSEDIAASLDQILEVTDAHVTDLSRLQFLS